jgi:hypothetical protein
MEAATSSENSVSLPTHQTKIRWVIEGKKEFNCGKQEQ